MLIIHRNANNTFGVLRNETSPKMINVQRWKSEKKEELKRLVAFSFSFLARKKEEELTAFE